MHKPDTAFLEQQLLEFHEASIRQSRDFLTKLWRFESQATGMMTVISELIAELYLPLNTTVSMEASSVYKNEDSIATQPKVQANIDALTVEVFAQKISAVVQKDNAWVQQRFIEFKTLMNHQAQLNSKQYQVMERIIFAGYDISLTLADIVALEKKVIETVTQRQMEIQIAQALAPLDALPAGIITDAQRQQIQGQTQGLVSRLHAEFQPSAPVTLQSNNEMCVMLSAEEKNSRFASKLTNFFGESIKGALDISRRLVRDVIAKEFGKQYVACLPEIGEQKSYQRVVLDVLDRILRIANSPLYREVEVANSELAIQVILQGAQIDQPVEHHTAIGFALLDAYRYVHIEDHVDEYISRAMTNVKL